MKPASLDRAWRLSPTREHDAIGGWKASVPRRALPITTPDGSSAAAFQGQTGDRSRISRHSERN